jgi:hypothetical protein
MRATAFFLAGLVAACAFEQDSTQPALRVSGHDKMVYAEACPHPERLATLCAAKPGQDACQAVALCQWAAGEKPGRQCRRRACRTPNIQPVGNLLPRRRQPARDRAQKQKSRRWAMMQRPHAPAFL